VIAEAECSSRFPLTLKVFFSLLVQSQTQNYLSDERYSHPCSTRIEKGLDHRPKRPAIYLKSQGRMFLITAEGIDILCASYFFIKVHGRSKCWCTMDKVSDKKVQRRASHKKRVWTIRVWAKQGVNTSVPGERRQDSVVKKGKLIQLFI
jgi:hypothetical protein